MYCQQGHLLLPHIRSLLIAKDAMLALKWKSLTADPFAYKFSFCSFFNLAVAHLLRTCRLIPYNLLASSPLWPWWGPEFPSGLEKKKKWLNLGCHRQNSPDDKGDDFSEAIAIGGTFISENASSERKGSQVLQRRGGKDVIDKSYGGAWETMGTAIFESLGDADVSLILGCARTRRSFVLIHFPGKLKGEGTSLVVQWLRICLAIQRTEVQYLIWELRSHKPWGN